MSIEDCNRKNTIKNSRKNNFTFFEGSRREFEILQIIIFTLFVYLILFPEVAVGNSVHP